MGSIGFEVENSSGETKSRLIWAHLGRVWVKPGAGLIRTGGLGLGPPCASVNLVWKGLR